MNQQIATSLTPEQRALLAGIAAPDVAGKALPPIKLVQSNSPFLLNLPDNELYVPGAIAGGFIVPDREGRAFLPAQPGLRFGIFGWSTAWNIFEKRPDGNNQRVDFLPQKPSDAVWRENSEGRRACVNDQGHAVVETLSCYLRLAKTGHVGRFEFSKTSLRAGHELASRSQRLSVQGGDVKGSVLGLFQMSSRLEKQGSRSWFLPVTIQIGKLGEANGPSLADVFTLAKLRQAFLEGAPLPEAAAAPAIAAPASQAPPRQIRPVITSGRANVEAPPPVEYAGPSEMDNDIPF